MNIILLILLLIAVWSCGYLIIDRLMMHYRLYKMNEQITEFLNDRKKFEIPEWHPDTYPNIEDIEDIIEEFKTEE